MTRIYLTTLGILFVLLLAGCLSTSPNSLPRETIANNNVSENSEQANKAAETPFPASTISIVRANSTSSLGLPAPDFTALPASTALAREGWQIYASSMFEVIVEYPSDWMAKEEIDGVYFTSPEGAVIVFSRTDANMNNDEIIVANRHCSIRTNPYNLTAEVCIETTSFSLSARFTLTDTNGSTEVLMMKTITRSTIEVFDAMFASVHQ